MQSGKSDPYVHCFCNHMNKKSKVCKATLDPEWNEYIDFEGPFGLLTQKPIELMIYDADLIGKESLGQVAVPLDFLKHEGSMDFNMPLEQGSIEFTVKWDATAEAAVASTYLRVHLKRAVGLKATDTSFMQSGKSDPLVQVIAGGEQKESKVIKATCDPVFDEYMDFEGSLDDFCRSPLQLKMLDQDMLGKESLGDCEVSLSADEINWGPKSEKPRGFKENLSLQGWLQFSVMFGTQAALEQMDVREELKREAAREKGTLRVFLVSASGLKAADTGFMGSGKSDPYVTVECGDGQKKHTKVIKANLDPEWHELLEFSGVAGEFSTKPLSLHVYDEDLKGLSKDSLGEVQLYPNVDKLRKSGAQEYQEKLVGDGAQGTLDFNVQWENAEMQQARIAQEELARREARRLNPQGKLTVHLKRARNLKAADTGFMQSGKSDPYCMVKAGGQELKSKTHSSTVDPEFDEELTFEAERSAFLEQPFELHFWDKDLIGGEKLGELKAVKLDWIKKKTHKNFKEAIEEQGEVEFTIKWEVLHEDADDDALPEASAS